MSPKGAWNGSLSPQLGVCQRWPSLLLYFCDKGLTKINLESKAFIWLTGCSSSQRKAKAGAQRATKAENIEECCFPACSPWLAQLVFLHICAHHTRSGTAHNGWGLLPSISSQEDALHRLVHRAIWWKQFSIEIPSTQVTLAYFKLIQTDQCRG